MKVIGINEFECRVEIYDIPDHLETDDVTYFLESQGFNSKGLTFIVVPIDKVPVQQTEFVFNADMCDYECQTTSHLI